MGRNTFLINSRSHKLRVFRIGATAKILSNGYNAVNELGIVHTHFTYEVFLVTNGQLKLITENGETVYERSAVIIPPRMAHYSEPSSDGSYCLLLSFEREDTALENAVKNKISSARLSDDAVFYAMKAAEKLESGSLGDEKDAELLMTLLFNEITEALLPDARSDGATQNSQRHINAIESIVNSHLKSGITLSEIASRVYLSKRQVSRIIAKEYGCSLPELINGKRMKAAEIMFRTKDISISRVAEEVGISSEGYFYRLFKKKYGLTPLQYRKRCASENADKRRKL